MIADEAAEFESKLVVSEKLAKARSVKAGSMADAVASIEKPKDRTRAKAAKAAKVSERKMGEMLAQTERAKGSKGQLKGDIPKGTKLVGSNHTSPPTDQTPTLAELGVTKRESAAPPGHPQAIW